MVEQFIFLPMTTFTSKSNLSGIHLHCHNAISHSSIYPSISTLYLHIPLLLLMLPACSTHHNPPTMPHPQATTPLLPSHKPRHPWGSLCCRIHWWDAAASRSTERIAQVTSSRKKRETYSQTNKKKATPHLTNQILPLKKFFKVVTNFLRTTIRNVPHKPC